MRTLQFNVIADSRFQTDLKAAMSYMVGEILRGLNRIPGVVAVPKNFRIFSFDGDRKGDPKTISHRTTIHVQKTTRRVTWDDIYGIINQTQAAPYSFVNIAPIIRGE